MTAGPTDTSQDPAGGAPGAAAAEPATTGDDTTTDQGHHQEDAMASSTRKNTAAGDASGTDTEQTTLEQAAPGLATRTHPSAAAVLPDPLFASELEVVQAPPMFWMVDESGEFHAAGDYETFQRLRAAGCKVSDSAPEGAPAATGGVVI